MTRICMFTPLDAPTGTAVAQAMLDAGHGLALVETGGNGPSGAAAHWTDTPAVLEAVRNADLVVYWVDTHGVAKGALTWLARQPGVMCIDDIPGTSDVVLAMAMAQAAGVIATAAHPALTEYAGPVHMLAGPTPHGWVEAVDVFGPQAMLALPLRSALRHFGVTLAAWGGAPDLLGAPAFDAPLDVLRSGRHFL